MAESIWRKNTTDPHPLFSGYVAQYKKDRAWRAGIPRAGAGVVLTQEEADEAYAWADKFMRDHVRSG